MEVIQKLPLQRTKCRFPVTSPASSARIQFGTQIPRIAQPRRGMASVSQVRRPGQPQQMQQRVARPPPKPIEEDDAFDEEEEMETPPPKVRTQAQQIPAQQKRPAPTNFQQNAQTAQRFAAGKIPLQPASNLPPSNRRGGITVLQPNQVKLDLLHFEEVKKNLKGGSYIPITYGTGPDGTPRSLKIQTPVVRLPFGISTTMDEATQAKRYAVTLAMDECPADSPLGQFKSLIESIDNTIVAECLANPSKWFPHTANKPAFPDIIKHNFKTTIRSPSNEKYSPTMRLKIPASEHGPVIEVFRNREQEFPLSEVKSNAKVIAIIELKGVWIIGGSNWGTSWNVLQMKVEDPGSSAKLKGYAFLD